MQPNIGNPIVSIIGNGPPLLSREALLASMLLELGYELALPKAFQDVTHADTGAREFFFQFKGAGVLQIGGGVDPLSVRVVRDRILGQEKAGCAEIAWRARLYEEFVPGVAPVKALKALAFPDEESKKRLVQQYRIVLTTVDELRRHIAIRRGGRVYYLYQDMTAEEREKAIRELDS